MLYSLEFLWKTQKFKNNKSDDRNDTLNFSPGHLRDEKNFSVRSKKWSSKGKGGGADFTICITDSHPSSHTGAQNNKGAAPALEITLAGSVTDFLKFFKAGRQPTSWGHVRCRSLYRGSKTKAGDEAEHTQNKQGDGWGKGSTIALEPNAQTNGQIFATPAGTLQTRVTKILVLNTKALLWSICENAVHTHRITHVHETLDSSKTTL